MAHGGLVTGSWQLVVGWLAVPPLFLSPCHMGLRARGGKGGHACAQVECGRAGNTSVCDAMLETFPRTQLLTHVDVRVVRGGQGLEHWAQVHSTLQPHSFP